MKTKLTTLILLLSALYGTPGFNQVEFKVHTIVQPGYSASLTEKSGILSGDIDQDGDEDIVQFSGGEGTIWWHENLDSNGLFNSYKVIAQDLKDLQYFVMEDMDSDRDLDIICLTDKGKTLQIYTYHEESKQFKLNLSYTPKEFDWMDAVICTDYDADGDVDLLIQPRFDRSIYLVENENKGLNFAKEVFAFNPKGVYPHYILKYIAKDIDDDGYEDLFAYSMGNVIWIKNKGGSGKYEIKKTLYSNARGGVSSAYVSDVDKNGKLDVVYSNSLKDHIYIQYDFVSNSVLDSIYGGSSTLYFGLSDVNNDGKEDLVRFGDSQILLNQNGRFLQSEHKIASKIGMFNVIGGMPVFSDLNGDGREDIIISNMKGVFWMKNTDRGFDNSVKLFLSAAGSREAFHIDIDNDNDMDLISLSSLDRNLILFKNIDGKGKFVQEQISSITQGVNFIHIGDFDKDGDADIALTTYLGRSSKYSTNDLLFLNNIDGKGTFELYDPEINLGEKTSIFLFEDVDKDDKMDLITCSYEDGSLMYFENFEDDHLVNGRTISSHVEEINSLKLQDLNGDGFKDAIVTCRYNSRVSIFYFDKLKKVFGKQVKLTENIAHTGNVALDDFDNNGSLDFALSSPWHRKLSIFKFRSKDDYEEIIFAKDLKGNSKIVSGKIDEDELPDLLTCIKKSENEESQIVWYQMNASLNPKMHRITDQIKSPVFAKLCDLDGDGDLDIYAGSKQEFIWVENLSN